MTALDQIPTPLAALLWLETVSAVCVLLVAPVIGWWTLRTRRKHAEDFERRHAEILRALQENGQRLAETIRAFENIERRHAELSRAVQISRLGRVA
jgi:hypothetical protein